VTLKHPFQMASTRKMDTFFCQYCITPSQKKKPTNASSTAEYIFKLEIIESNNMEGFQRELIPHVNQYDAIKVKERKKITNHLIHQYHKIDLPPFQIRFNIRVLVGPKEQMKYSWMCTLLEWKTSTCHDLIMHNIWHKP
jgi:hypothetical protein